MLDQQQETGTLFNKADLLASFNRLNEQGSQFYAAFYSEFVATHSRIEQLMQHVDTARRHRILAQSLTFTVLVSDGSEAPEELNRLRTWHGPSGIAISYDMLLCWRRAFLTVLDRFDPLLTAVLTEQWQYATLNLINHFQTDS